jgi:Icc-related predicted phosphoesterase
MKILHVADLHLRREWLDWVAMRAIDFDLLVIAGDVLNTFSDVSPQLQVFEASCWLTSLKVRALVCSGNHDHWAKVSGKQDPDAEAAWLRRLRGKGCLVGVDGDRAEIAGCLFECVGWTGVPTGPADFYVIHAPPRGADTAISDKGRDLGNPALGCHLHNHGGIALCGHVHAPSKVYDLRVPFLSLNPGCSETAKTPNHWIIDTTRREATWHGGEDPLNIHY